MALALTKPKSVTPAQYLALEEVATTKSEYFRGEIFMMAGGSPNHNRIAGNIFAEFNVGLRGRRCEVFNSDQRLLVNGNGLYTYPDAMIVCGKIEFADPNRQVITNPTVIVEGLSPATKNYDQTCGCFETEQNKESKFELYRDIPSFRDYILAHQDEVYIEYFHKGEDGRWVLTEFKVLTDQIRIIAIDLALSLDRIYERVEWASNRNMSDE